MKQVKETRKNKYWDVDVLGNVWATDTMKKIKVRVNNTGYPTFSEFINRKNKNILLHRAIAEKFIPNPHKKQFINHKDGNKKNFSLKNLEWVTHKENMQHAIKTKLWNPVTSLKVSNGDVQKLRKLFKLGYSHERLSKIFNISKKYSSALNTGVGGRKNFN